MEILFVISIFLAIFCGIAIFWYSINRAKIIPVWYVLGFAIGATGIITHVIGIW